MSPRYLPRRPDAGPAPFLKWAGGKRQLLAQFARFFPEPGSYGTYHEPFVGGGAVFFHLRPQQAALSDNNEDLIEAYEVVRDRVTALIRLLREYPNDEGFFYRMRAVDPCGLSPVERVARMIYLNKTCYNGLYRVNSRGLFNVPFGRYVNPSICDEANLRAVSGSLHGVALCCQPFEKVLEQAVPGDFVYFDPPYQPLSVTSSFTAYTSASFGADDQRRLAQVFAQLAERGCRVMLSNSDTPFTRDLYRDFRIEQVLANRAINSRVEGRGKIPEVLVLDR